MFRSFIPTRRDARRRGATAVMVVIIMTMLLGFAALTVDMGVLYNTRSDLQRTADAASLAGAIALMDDTRLQGDAQLYTAITGARSESVEYTGSNAVYGVTSPILNNSDVSVGYYSDPTSTTETMDLSNPERYNAVRVRVRRDSTANGPVELLFAKIFGRTSSQVTADSAAAFMDGINGFRVNDRTGNAGLLPIALRTTAWENFQDGIWASGDNYSYDPSTGTVSPGADGVMELNLYPGGGGGFLPPGNFGTVDIGSPTNATPDLARQIREGVNESDLSYFGGEFSLGDDGQILVNGDTGLSAALKDPLTEVIGQPRTIPLFSNVTGPGNNAWFTIVGFAGIRIMDVKLTGSMSSKKVIIQPALVVDDAAQAGPSNGSSYFVYQPVRLVR